MEIWFFFNSITADSRCTLSRKIKKKGKNTYTLSKKDPNQITCEIFEHVDRSTWSLESKKRVKDPSSVLNVLQPTSAFLSAVRARELHGTRHINGQTATAGEPTRSTEPWWPSDHPAEYPGGSPTRTSTFPRTIGRSHHQPPVLSSYLIRIRTCTERRTWVETRNFYVTAVEKKKERSYRAIFGYLTFKGKGGEGRKAHVGEHEHAFFASHPAGGEGAASRREQIGFGEAKDPRSSSFSPPHFHPIRILGRILVNPAPESAIIHPPGDREREARIVGGLPCFLVPFTCFCRGLLSGRFGAHRSGGGDCSSFLFVFLDLWTCGGGRCECGFVFVVVAACWSASRKHRFFRPDCSSSGLFVGRWNREVAWSWYQVLAFFFETSIRY